MFPRGSNFLPKIQTPKVPLNPSSGAGSPLPKAKTLSLHESGRAFLHTEGPKGETGLTVINNAQQTPRSGDVVLNTAHMQFHTVDDESARKFLDDARDELPEGGKLTLCYDPYSSPMKEGERSRSTARVLDLLPKGLEEERLKVWSRSNAAYDPGNLSQPFTPGTSTFTAETLKSLRNNDGDKMDAYMAGAVGGHV